MPVRKSQIAFGGTAPRTHGLFHPGGDIISARGGEQGRASVSHKDLSCRYSPTQTGLAKLRLEPMKHRSISSAKLTFRKIWLIREDEREINQSHPQV